MTPAATVAWWLPAGEPEGPVVSAVAVHAPAAGWTTAGLLAGVLVVLVACWLAYARAVRVDRLHRQVLGARATLEAQLALRAQAAGELAASGVLDPASSLLLSQAAHDALEADGPLVDDGLDPADRTRRAGAAHGSTEEGTSLTRARAESDLSLVIRTVLPAEVRGELSGDPIGRACLERLERTGYRVTLARSFHNTHVAEARRLRALPSVRLLHLAGRAPLPVTVDIDDDVTMGAQLTAPASRGPVASADGLEVTQAAPDGRERGSGRLGAP